MKPNNKWKCGKELRQLPKAERKQIISWRQKIALGSAALMAVGLGAGIKSGRDASATSQKPNAVAKVTFNSLGTNWDAANKILELEGNPNGNPLPVVDKLQSSEAIHYPTLLDGTVDAGEQVNYYFHTSQPQLGRDIKDNTSNNSISQSVQIEVQTSPENQTQNR